MDDLIKTAIEQFPTLTGVFLLAFVLWRQTEKLTKMLQDRITAVEKKVDLLTELFHTK